MNSLTHRPRRGGFTMIELLVVIVILALLVGLLLPAINAAVKNARNATVSAEINQFSQAMADFKSRYGDYPPSRIYLAENGNYSLATGTTATFTYATGTSDISDQDLARRSLRYLRKFFPRVVLSTTGAVTGTTVGSFYDFDGNGVLATNAYVLQGHECLVFFLGGLPAKSLDPSGKLMFSMTGFSRNPVNPFTTIGTNRQPPLFEFNNSRLVDDPKQYSTAANSNPIFPAYYDPLGTNSYYAYFSAYGNGSYDPNDVNFPNEADDQGTSPITLQFSVAFPIGGSTTNNTATSASPNPYTASVPVTSVTVPSVAYQNAQSFQIISAGVDGNYGIGGIYSPTANQVLPPETSYTNSTDIAVRTRESDNITNFHSGKLD